MEKVIHDPLQSQDFPFHEPGIGMFRGTGLKVFLLDEQGAFDGGQRIADFVGHAGGEQPQGGQLLVALHQGLAFHQFDAQRRDHVPVNHAGQRHAEHKQQPQRTEHQPAELRERLICVCEQLPARIIVGFAQSLAQIEEMLRRRAERTKVSQRSALPAEGLQLHLQIPGDPHVIIVSDINLLQRIPFLLRGQLGFLFVNPAIEFVAGFEEFVPDRRIVIRSVTLHRIVQFAERVAELIRDPEALEIHLAEPRAQLRRLPLRSQGRQQDQRAHQRHDQRERHQSEPDSKFHSEVKKLTDMDDDWPQEPVLSEFGCRARRKECLPKRLVTSSPTN